MTMIEAGKSDLTSDGFFRATVAGGGDYGPGIVRRCCGYHTWQRLGVYKDARSRSGLSGCLVFDCREPGLYEAVGFAQSSSRSGRIAFEVDVDGTATKVTDLKAAMRGVDPKGADSYEAWAQAEADARAVARARDEARRNAFHDAYALQSPVSFAFEADKLRAIIRTPLMEDRVPAFDGAMDALVFVRWANDSKHIIPISRGPACARYALPDPDAEAVIGLAITPGHTGDDATGTLFYLAADGDFEPVSEAAYRDAERCAQARLTDGLPELTGTVKQVAWANDIRAKLANVDPKHRALRRATRAKYYIENRHALLQMRPVG